MKIVKQNFEILDPIDEAGFFAECRKIERIGRVCYKSEDKITGDSWRKFLTMLREKQHGAMLEHSQMSVLFTTDRGISHEIVRHRIASFAQESTRYCNYSKAKFGKEITVIDPNFDLDDINYWMKAMEEAEEQYFKLIDNGQTAQMARSVLPNSLKTEIVMTANFREWLHFFNLRCAPAAHPQMRELVTPLYKYLHGIIPEVFSSNTLDNN